MVGNHDFGNFEEVVNVKSKFRPNGEVMIKCGFCIENIQPAPTEYTVPILNIRYWSTEPY